MSACELLGYGLEALVPMLGPREGWARVKGVDVAVLASGDAGGRDDVRWMGGL